MAIEFIKIIILIIPISIATLKLIKSFYSKKIQYEELEKTLYRQFFSIKTRNNREVKIEDSFIEFRGQKIFYRRPDKKEEKVIYESLIKNFKEKLSNRLKNKKRK